MGYSICFWLFNIFEKLDAVYWSVLLTSLKSFTQMVHSFSLLQLCDFIAHICDVTYYYLDNIVLLQQEAGDLGLAKLYVFTS